MTGDDINAMISKLVMVKEMLEMAEKTDVFGVVLIDQQKQKLRDDAQKLHDEVKTKLKETKEIIG